MDRVHDCSDEYIRARAVARDSRAAASGRLGGAAAEPASDAAAAFRAAGKVEEDSGKRSDAGGFCEKAARGEPRWSGSLLSVDDHGTVRGDVCSCKSHHTSHQASSNPRTSLYGQLSVFIGAGIDAEPLRHHGALEPRRRQRRRRSQGRGVVRTERQPQQGRRVL